MKLINLTGQKFGKLTVIMRDASRKGTYWLCKCDCGNIVSVRKDQLTRKKNPKQCCGCDVGRRIGKANTKDETGNQYGYLTVLYRTTDLRPGEARWHCKCKCGKETDVSGVHLRNGSVQSCGCKKYESHNGIDETGNRYGNLVVVERSYDKNNNSHIFWKCKCDCGNECVVNGTYLRQGISTNCGCKRSVGEDTIVKLLTKANIPFKREYNFPDLIGPGGGRLRFDFGILDKDNNLLYLIEYDGVQHFQPGCFGCDDELFTTLKKHDKIKNEYCKKKKIPLIRIKYTQLKKISIKDLILEKAGDEE